MKDYRIMPQVLFQYSCAVPEGKRVLDCIRDQTVMRALAQLDTVAVIGRRGNLKKLNLSGTMILEGLYQGLSTLEILRMLLSVFARDRQDAPGIASDLAAFLAELQQHLLIESL